MNRTESTVLEEMSRLMRKCPAASPNPYDMVGWIHACKDFQNINYLVSSILSDFSFYSLYKSKIGKDDFDYEEDVLMAKEKYENKLHELREFIDKRISESWA